MSALDKNIEEQGLEWLGVSPSDFQTLPKSAGVYRFYDQAACIIYVGKSKQLVKRVASYFQKTNRLDKKTQCLVQEVQKIDYVALGTEYDALLLENTLIKRYQPKYNILLRDDKTYPYLCLSHERFPRLFATRRTSTPGDYFGPYTDLNMMHALKSVLEKMLQLRTCKHALSARNVAKKQFKVCLDYHLGHCQGPCEALQEEADYNEQVAQAKAVLQGKLSWVKSRLQAQLKKAIEDLQFEKANLTQKKLQAIEKFQGKASVANLDMQEAEVCSILRKDKLWYVNYMQVERGMVVLSDTFKVSPKLEESEEDVLLLALAHARKKHQITPSVLLSNLVLNTWGVQSFVPKIGPKRKLVDISLRNAYTAYEQQQAKISAPRPAKVLRQVQRVLRLRESPMHIECFDISNLGAEYIVGAMTCFKQGKPDKASYRYFNTQVTGKPNDYEAMREVIQRRYTRLKIEKKPMPQLIIIDGGKGQLGKAYTVLKDLGLNVDVIGLAKRVEEVFLPGLSEPLLLQSKSEALLLLQRIRDETHRFVLGFHRKKRIKGSFDSALDTVKGIGSVSKKKLMRAYDSIEAIKQASIEDLKQYLNSKQIVSLQEALGIEQEFNIPRVDFQTL